MVRGAAVTLGAGVTTGGGSVYRARSRGAFRSLPSATAPAMSASVRMPSGWPVCVSRIMRALPGDDGRRGAAAVHVEHASVDERGLVAGEVDRGVGDGLRVSGTAGDRKSVV